MIDWSPLEAFAGLSTRLKELSMPSPEWQHWRQSNFTPGCVVERKATYRYDVCMKRRQKKKKLPMALISHVVTHWHARWSQPWTLQWEQNIGRGTRRMPTGLVFLSFFLTGCVIWGARRRERYKEEWGTRSATEKRKKKMVKRLWITQELSVCPSRWESWWCLTTWTPIAASSSVSKNSAASVRSRSSASVSGRKSSASTSSRLGAIRRVNPDIN